MTQGPAIAQPLGGWFKPGDNIGQLVGFLKVHEIQNEWNELTKAYRDVYIVDLVILNGPTAPVQRRCKVAHPGIVGRLDVENKTIVLGVIGQGEKKSRDMDAPYILLGHSAEQGDWFTTQWWPQYAAQQAREAGPQTSQPAQRMAAPAAPPAPAGPPAQQWAPQAQQYVQQAPPPAPMPQQAPPQAAQYQQAQYQQAPPAAPAPQYQQQQMAPPPAAPPVPAGLPPHAWPEGAAPSPAASMMPPAAAPAAPVAGNGVPQGPPPGFDPAAADPATAALAQQMWGTPVPAGQPGA